MHAPPDHHAGAGQRGRTPARWRAATVTAGVAAAALSLAAGPVPAPAASGYTVTATIPVGAVPTGVAVDPAAGTIYVANGDDSVSVINAATRTVTATIPVGTSPYAVAVNPATDTAYVTNRGDDTVSVISAAQPVSGPIESGYRAGKCVADTGDSAANKTPITIAPCDGSPGQDWTVTGTGTLQVNGKCLDIYRQRKTNKAPSSSTDAPAAPTSNGKSPDAARRNAGHRLITSPS